MIIRFIWILSLLTQIAWPQGIIRLKTRNFVPAVSQGNASPGRPATSAKRHYLVLFGAYPGPDVLAELAARRIQVLAYVPDNALMVSAVALNLRGLSVIWSGPMDPADKISPVISSQPAAAYLVIFQPDTEIGTDGELAGNLGFTIVQNPNLLAGQLLLSGAYSALPALAALDAVAYILPASAGLQDGDAIVGCAGALTAVGPAAQYVQAGSGWSKDATGQVSLAYYFDSVTPKVPEALVRSEIVRAFAVWEQYANITIAPATQTNLERSIDILFARYAHGDAYPFDGPGGVLAHTFYPVPNNNEPIAGDMHLDADESWNVGANVDIFSVALHEAGHALGLAHSDNPDAVMYPYYRLQTGLNADDIAGIQALYGAKTAAVTPPAGGAGASGGTGTTGTGTGSGTGGTGTTGTGGGTGASTGTGTTGSGSTGTGAAAGPDTVPPTLTIVSPSSSIVSAYSATISIGGTAADNAGVQSVQWTTSTGGAGTATGTTFWSATIPLLVGNNTVTVRAYDAAGNSAWRAVTVVRYQ
jgi:hypothetical protein